MKANFQALSIDLRYKFSSAISSNRTSTKRANFISSKTSYEVDPAPNKKCFFSSGSKPILGIARVLLPGFDDVVPPQVHDLALLVSEDLFHVQVDKRN